jgi:hypothetical protein
VGFLGFLGGFFIGNPAPKVWVTEGVISSLTFHPVERLLVIATYNELHFWDWSSTEPAVKVIVNTTFSNPYIYLGVSLWVPYNTVTSVLDPYP